MRLAICALLVAPLFAGVRLGGIYVGAGYTRWAGYYPWYWSYDPFFYSPYYATGFVRGPNMGQVRLQSFDRSAEVFLDGGYAGKAGELKSIWLRPGKYDLEVRSSGTTFSRKIYVLSGKTMRLP